MKSLVMFGAILLAGTKLLDTWTTWRHIGAASDESNPLARGIMRGLGVRQGILLTSMLAFLIITTSAWLAMRSGWLAQILFFIWAVLISAIQAAVAHNNWSGQGNFITRVVLFAYHWMGRRRGN